MSKDSMYLYGKNSVLERLKANPKSITKVFFERGFDDKRLLNEVRSRKIDSEHVDGRQLLRIKKADRLQGVVALVNPFKYTDFDDLLEGAKEKKTTIICLDNINDPHNLGSIIRTAACFGDFAIAIPKHGSCEVTDAVLHVASGGENFIPVSMVNNTSVALEKAKNAGFWVAGAVVEDGEDINKVSLPFPLCIVLGSEEKGIRHGVKKNLDIKVRIPMKGAGLSFNVAMAGAIFAYEITRQKAAS